MPAQSGVVRPADVLPLGASSAICDGQRIRTGTVAAFVRNAQALRRCPAESAEHAAIRAELVRLAPALRAIGVFDVFTPTDREIAAMIACDG
ncbi:hypothetical protein [Williamsia sp. CHRR-6]|uniref:DUF7709 family protein n=1 Tax=Williamsia sp. CHRR-6 TaxID=2835871 RepID=UPI001BDB5558|nr:hypothetical protein [Williamsia sp. CHRR-6]MBT0566527.1 hypothetical protein [Williamsia sp. CHRR-6]